MERLGSKRRRQTFSTAKHLHLEGLSRATASFPKLGVGGSPTGGIPNRGGTLIIVQAAFAHKRVLLKIGWQNP
jgi:hypothetical protein